MQVLSKTDVGPALTGLRDSQRCGFHVVSILVVPTDTHAHPGHLYFSTCLAPHLTHFLPAPLDSTLALAASDWLRS